MGSVRLTNMLISRHFARSIVAVANRRREPDMKDLRRSLLLLLAVLVFGAALIYMMGFQHIPTAADAEKPLSQLPARGAPS